MKIFVRTPPSRDYVSRIGATTKDHQCHCGVTVNRKGHHDLSCRRSASRQLHLGFINDIICRALATINLSVISTRAEQYRT